MFSKLRAFLLLLLPSWLLTIIFRKIYPELKSIKFGFSWLDVPSLTFDGLVEVGNFNFFSISSLSLSNAKIGSFNRFRGLFSCSVQGEIGNFNSFLNSNHVYIGVCDLRKGSKVTSRHYIDLSGDFVLGEGALIAGQGTQVWTHSYGFFDGRRYRIDGNVEIGDFCYIGSRAILQGPLRIASKIVAGAGTTLAGDICDAGSLIVSAKNRSLEGRDLSSSNPSFSFDYKDEAEPCLWRYFK